VVKVASRRAIVDYLKNCYPRQGLAALAMRCDRCANTFFSAICIAATVIFYLN
jgi:hypothetical protein